MEPSRNAPCPCGSKKKYKRCCANKKNRHTTYVYEFRDVNVTSGHIELNRMTLGVDLVSEGRRYHPVSVTKSLRLKRTKGDKVVLEVPVSIHRPIGQTEREILEYQKVFAIDTNTRNIRGERVSVASLTICMWDLTSDGALFRYGCGQSYEYRGLTGDEEKNALWDIIERHFITTEGGADERTLLVIDTDGGHLREFNLRSRPIIGDRYLPRNITLVYASADKKNDSLYNKLIATSDAVSTEVLNEIEGSIDKDECWLRVEGKPYTKLRVWVEERTGTLEKQ
jgi:hypothetical protein